jgi:hypothetical protein
MEKLLGSAKGLYSPGEAVPELDEAGLLEKRAC